MPIPTKHEDRSEILTLRNQGWTNAQIARKLEKHPSSTLRMYRRVKNKTVEELEQDMLNDKLPIA